jgi:hypothetical protein
MRSVLLVVSICVALIAVLAAIFIVPAAAPVRQIAEQTANTAGIPVGVAPGPRQMMRPDLATPRVDRGAR